MLVYILSKDSKPLMPCSPSKARRLLKEQKAQVVKRTPFTIQLLYGSSGYKQEITLGVDAGSNVVGLSAVTKKREVFSGELQLRNDIVELLAIRNRNRRNRRSRKTRYRKQKLYITHSRKEGWFSPSAINKIETHERIISKLYQILPITKVVVETASFDIEKIKNPEIRGVEYQTGPQKDFYNVRACVLHRDGHRCHGKTSCKNKTLQVHHIESRKTGGDSPNNLITLCKECHDSYHKGTLKLNFKRGRCFRHETFMSTTRKLLASRLKACYPIVKETFGYLTNNLRIESELEKSHRNDALCITGNPLVFRDSSRFLMKQIRKHNRQIHKTNFLKLGRKKLNQAPYLVHGFRLFDKVLYDKQECFIFVRRLRGTFDVRLLDGTKISGDLKYNKIRLIEKRTTILCTINMANASND